MTSIIPTRLHTNHADGPHQQVTAFCRSTKTAPELPEERGQEFNVLTGPQKSPDPNLTAPRWDVPDDRGLTVDKPWLLSLETDT